MKIVYGNLLDFPDNINVICHQANINNTFGAGIANQIRKRYPEAFSADTKAHKNQTAQFGNVSYCKLKNNKFIFNCYGQSLYNKSIAGVPTSYDAVYASLNKTKTILNKIHEITNGKFIPHIGFPYMMGCGLGGGNWEIYKCIIEETIGNTFPYTYVKYDG